MTQWQDCDPVGLAEIARRLGKKTETPRTWRQRQLLPEPQWTVSGQPAWNWSVIEEWAKSSGRLTVEASGAPGPLRSPDELLLAAHAIGYELSALIDDLVHINEDNAFLEAFLVHYRNLAEFLVGRPNGRRDTDITPWDFLTTWVPKPPASAQRMQAMFPDIDRHLSHLTWVRVTWRPPEDAEPKEWEWGSMTEDVLRLFDRFATAAYKERTGQDTLHLVHRAQVGMMKLKDHLQSA